MGKKYNKNKKPTKPQGEDFKRYSVSFLSRLFNIAPSQWPRVTECWFVIFFFKLGSAVGFTVITAAFVSQFGIAFLPLLFVINALLIIASTFFFENFIVKIKKELLMIIMVAAAAVLLFSASYLYDTSPYLFFGLVIFAESFFLAQYNVFLPLFVGDRFTPLESQRTFSFVESSDTIGLMLGGTLVGLLANKISVPGFLYVWIAFLACIVFVFVIESYFFPGLPPLPFRSSGKHAQQNIKPENQLKKVVATIKHMPFLKGLIIIVLFQWVFMNMLEFQFTKAMEQHVRHAPESTIALRDGHHATPSWFQAAVLSSPEGVRNLDNFDEAVFARALTYEEQERLTQILGYFKGLFHFGALIVQILFSSRLIQGLGIVGALIIHPVIMLMSLVGMFLKFGYVSSVVGRMNYELTNVVYKNAYLASHYAFPRNIRDQAAEFLEGIVRPMGTIIGMLLLLGIQSFVGGKELTMWIHVVMITIMMIVLIATIKLQSKYTDISREQLLSPLPYPEKLNALEILEQRGHNKAHDIFVQMFRMEKHDEESIFVRERLLEALGNAGRMESLPILLEALYDANESIRLAAAHALMNYENIGHKFTTQAFSHYRMIQTLKDVFHRDSSPEVRSAVMRVFAILREPDTIAFLLKTLQDADDNTRADCLYTFGLFQDPTAAYYIKEFLDHPNPRLRANAIVALWHFPEYQTQLEPMIYEMMKHKDPTEVVQGIYAAGEAKLPCRRLLHRFLEDERPEVRFQAAKTLAQLADLAGFDILLEVLTTATPEEFSQFKHFYENICPKARQLFEHALVHAVSREFNQMMHNYGGRMISEIDPDILQRLRRLYILLNQHEELFAIDTALRKGSIVTSTV